MPHDLLRKKPLQFTAYSTLHHSLTLFDLIFMGIGAIIGAGIFVLTGIAAATKAGPAVVISYVVSGFAAMFAAFAYAELSASIGGTGSAYNYAYTGFGEFIAWMIGWDLLLEYMMTVSTVSIGWAGYVNNLFQAFNIHLPIFFTQNPFQGGGVNLLAVSIILGLTGLLCLGVKISARFNTVIVLLKLSAIAIFIVVASSNIQPAYWIDFMPFGWSGVMEGAALVFFAYIGFDALSTAVEESINPQRDLPIAILTSLSICTLLYIVVSLLLTGIVPYSTLDVPSPVADALLRLGYHTASGLIAAGAIAGLTTVMLIAFYALTRICYAITRDGLLPNQFAVIHPRLHTPIRIILFTGLINALVAGLMPIDKAAELVNIGTLAAFTIVSVGVIAFRTTHPDLKRPFKLPFYPYFPILGIFSCLYLMIHLPLVTWLRFFIWLVIGLVIYFTYSRKHSLLNKIN